MNRLLALAVVTSLAIAGCNAPTDAELIPEPEANPASSADADPFRADPVQSQALTFVVDGNTEGLILQVSMYADDYPLETRVLDGATATVTLTVPDADELISIGDGHPQMASYTVALIRDENGNGKVDWNEPYYGINNFWLGYLDGATPEYEAAGMNDGWVALDEISGRVLPLDALPMTQNLAPQQVLTLSGINRVPDQVDRIAVAPFGYLYEDLDAPLLDQPIDRHFSISIVGEPPADHWEEEAELGPATMEMIAAYRDEGEEGVYDDLDAAQALCFDGEPIVAVWTPVTSHLFLAIDWAEAGHRPGWSVGHAEDLVEASAFALDDVERTQLVIDPTECPLD